MDVGLPITSWAFTISATWYMHEFESSTYSCHTHIPSVTLAIIGWSLTIIAMRCLHHEGTSLPVKSSLHKQNCGCVSIMIQQRNCGLTLTGGDDWWWNVPSCQPLITISVMTKHFLHEHFHAKSTWRCLPCSSCEICIWCSNRTNTEFIYALQTHTVIVDVSVLLFCALRESEVYQTPNLMQSN